MKLKVKLNELTDADPRFVSLVTRGANRIPFRMVKFDKGAAQMASIDLSSAKNLFKKAEQKGPVAPGTVSGIIVINDAHKDAVKAAVKDAGFNTDTTIELEDGKALMYAQTADPEKDAHVVRLSEHALVTIKNFASFADTLKKNYDFVGEAAQKEEFFLGADIVAKSMQATLADTMANDPKAAQATLKQINTYLDTLAQGVPTAAFKLDKALAEIYKKAKPDAEDAGDGGADEDAEMTKPDSVPQKEWDAMSAAEQKAACNTTKAETKPTQKAGGSTNPDGYLEMPPNTDKAVWDLMDDDLRKQYSAAAAKVVSPQGASPSVQDLLSAATKGVEKTLSDKVDAMMAKVTDALAAVTTKTAELATQVTAAVTKAEAVEKVVKGTVDAPAAQDDVPAWESGVVSKYGDEFITDTAMQVRRQKYDDAKAAKAAR